MLLDASENKIPVLSIIKQWAYLIRVRLNNSTIIELTGTKAKQHSTPLQIFYQEKKK